MTDDQRRVINLLSGALLKAAEEVEPNYGYWATTGDYIMNRADLTDFVRRCFKVSLQELT